MLDFVAALFFVLGILGALGTAFLPNILHAAISLVFTLIAVAGLYGVLGADFLAAAQFVIYIGATIIVIIFAIMMTPNIYAEKFKEAYPNYKWPLALAVLIFSTLFALLKKSNFVLGKDEAVREATTRKMGEALLGPYALPFEYVSIVLLFGLVGAVVVARHKSSKGDQ